MNVQLQKDIVSASYALLRSAMTDKYKADIEVTKMQEALELAKIDQFNEITSTERG